MTHVHEHTKRAVDWIALALNAIAPLLGQLSLILTVIATTLTAVWYAIRIHDRIKYGRSKGGDA